MFDVFEEFGGVVFIGVFAFGDAIDIAKGSGFRVRSKKDLSKSVRCTTRRLTQE